MTETDWKRKEILILTKLKTFFCSATYGMVFNRWFAKCTLSFCILEKSTRLTGENMLGNHSSPDRLRSVLVRIFNAGMKTFENLPFFLFIFKIFILWFLKISKVKNVSENNRDSCRSSQVGEICEIPAHDMKKKVIFCQVRARRTRRRCPARMGENMIIGEEIWVNRKSFLESIFPFSEYQINFFEMIFNSHLHTFELVTLPFTLRLGWFLGSV